MTSTGGDAVELRQRAAEAAAWLPIDSSAKDIRALATDPEPTVRQAFARCHRERREREWAARYVEQIVAVQDEGRVPSEWRYGRALGRIGDDAVLEDLEQRRRDPDLPPAVRHWLARIVKDVRKHWDEVTRRWPEPWFARRGGLEEVTGEVTQPDGTETRFQGRLWQVIPSEPSGISSWGGGRRKQSCQWVRRPFV